MHAPEGTLPSDSVQLPSMRSNDTADFATMLVVIMTLFLADVIACIRAGVNTLRVIGGRAPNRCPKTCRLITDTQQRTTCGKACCLPEGHTAVWNHVCPEHFQLGGRVSSWEYKSFMLIQWWKRILTSITTACQLSCRAVWKWSACRAALCAPVSSLHSARGTTELWGLPTTPGSR